MKLGTLLSLICHDHTYTGKPLVSLDYEVSDYPTMETRDEGGVKTIKIFDGDNLLICCETVVDMN